MRISDWSSDVCSSDLAIEQEQRITGADAAKIDHARVRGEAAGKHLALDVRGVLGEGFECIEYRHMAFTLEVLTRNDRDRCRAFDLRALDARTGDRDASQFGGVRSEERRVGTGCVSKCRSWWGPVY